MHLTLLRSTIIQPRVVCLPFTKVSQEGREKKFLKERGRNVLWSPGIYSRRLFLIIGKEISVALETEKAAQKPEGDFKVNSRTEETRREVMVVLIAPIDAFK